MTLSSLKNIYVKESSIFTVILKGYACFSLTSSEGYPCSEEFFTGFVSQEQDNYKQFPSAWPWLPRTNSSSPHPLMVSHHFRDQGESDEGCWLRINISPILSLGPQPQAELTKPFHVFCCHYFAQGKVENRKHWLLNAIVSTNQLHPTDHYHKLTLQQSFREADLRRPCRTHTADSSYYYFKPKLNVQMSALRIHIEKW